MITARSIGYVSKYLYQRCINRSQRYLNNDHTISFAKKAQNNIKNEKHIVWLDMEMTGLEVEKYHIMEIACLVTDEELKPASDCLHIVIHQPDEILENMSDWCKIQHKKTGLVDDCQLSEISLEEAQQKILQYLESYVPKGKCPLAGNSVYMDRIFLMKYMPLVNDYLHYRIIDVSSIRELARRWYPSIIKAAPKKQHSHRAAIDVKDSLIELHYFRNNLFVSETEE